MKIITKPKLKLELNKTEARGIRKVYQETLDILKLPKHWIKGSYTEQGVDEWGDDERQYCLIGGIREVDGKWEELAQAFMLFNPPAGWEFELPEAPREEDLEEDPEEDLADPLTARELAEIGHDEVIEFNDNNDTSHKEVVKYLKTLIKKTDKIIAA
jgi:hypothetical protein